MNNGRVDILVGIPSYNNARTIGHVVKAVAAGLAKYFPDRKAVILNSDGGSKDGTSDIVKNADIDCKALLIQHPLSMSHRISTPYHGIPGKGSAIKTIFKNAVDMGADVCAVVDSDLRSITPEWVELLLKPVMSEGFDFVAPLYSRHKFDGTITNSIVYPMTRALYGKKIRQPIGGEFGFSRKLMEYYLSQDVWATDVARFGIDIWMTTEAISNGFKICQSFLGAKIHDPKDPGSDLGDMLVQVVGALFELTERHYDAWTIVSTTEDVDTFGFSYYAAQEHVRVDVGRMLRTYREGLKNLGEIWIEIMGRGDFGEISSLGNVDDYSFRFPPGLWARIVYDFAIAYKKRKFPPQQIIKSLLPLYLGKTASFVMDMDDKSQEDAEAEIETLCLKFEETKYHLANGWK